MNVLLDGIDIFHVFAGGIGVVKAQVADAPRVLGGDAEVKADGFGVPDMKVTVWLGRKPRHHASAVPAGFIVPGDHLAHEVMGWWGDRFLVRAPLRGAGFRGWQSHAVFDFGKP